MSNLTLSAGEENLVLARVLLDLTFNRAKKSMNIRTIEKMVIIGHQSWSARAGMLSSFNLIEGRDSPRGLPKERDNLPWLGATTLKALFQRWVSKEGRLEKHTHDTYQLTDKGLRYLLQLIINCDEGRRGDLDAVVLSLDTIRRFPKTVLKKYSRETDIVPGTWTAGKFKKSFMDIWRLWIEEAKQDQASLKVLRSIVDKLDKAGELEDLANSLTIASADEINEIARKLDKETEKFWFPRLYPFRNLSGTGKKENMYQLGWVPLLRMLRDSFDPDTMYAYIRGQGIEEWEVFAKYLREKWSSELTLLEKI